MSEFANVKRSAEEIKSLCLEMRESKEHKYTQFDDLSYEDGVMAAIRWLFFSTADFPADVKRVDLTASMEETKRRVFTEEHAQALENVG